MIPKASLPHFETKHYLLARFHEGANDGKGTHQEPLMSGDTVKPPSFESPMDRDLKEIYRYDPTLPMPKGSQIKIYTPKNAESFPMPVRGKSTHFVPVKQKESLKKETITAGIGLYPGFGKLEAKIPGGLNGGIDPNMDPNIKVHNDKDGGCYINEATKGIF